MIGAMSIQEMSTPAGSRNRTWVARLQASNLTNWAKPSSQLAQSPIQQESPANQELISN
jgi:hypothetical protein